MLVWFTRAGFASYFSVDDLMNTYLAWRTPLPRFAIESAVFFSPGYRPLGNLVYRLLYAFAGFHPLPFRITTFTFVLLNLFLMYRTAAGIASKEAGVLTTLFAAYNAAIDLYHDTGIIYDVLCFTFYFAALGYYVNIRRRKQYPVYGQLACFLILFIGALDSKEMAVTLPCMIILYELLLGESAPGSVVRRWTPSALGVLMTIPYVIGKLSGPSPLINNPDYALHLSPATYFNGLRYYLDLVISPHPGALAMWAFISILVGAAIICAVSRDLRLMFALAFVLITPLPFVFVALRTAYVMYIPLFGIALYLSIAIVKAREAWIGSSSRMQAATFAVCAAAVIVFHFERLWPAQDNSLIQSTVAQLSQVRPRVTSDSKILFLDDPLDTDSGWTLLFICRLYYGLPDLAVDRVKVMSKKPSQAEIDSHDVIFTYRNARWIRLKP